MPSKAGLPAFRKNDSKEHLQKSRNHRKNSREDEKRGADQILNPDQEPYLDFAEEERRQKKRQFAPWTTQNPELLAIARDYFPDIPIQDSQKLTKPDLSSVEINALSSHAAIIANQENTFDVITVGGPPAAMIALQEATQGKRVLYVNNRNIDQDSAAARPIWLGSGFHGEPDVYTEAPAYVTGHEPLKFLWNEFKNLWNPPRFDSDVLKADFSWQSLNITDWLHNPAQWFKGLRVAFGNYQLARRFAKDETAHALLQEMQIRIHQSGDYLEKLSQKIPGFLRTPRGSLITASDTRIWQNLLTMQQQLAAEALTLRVISEEEAKMRYGFIPRGIVGMMEKTHDFIFTQQYLDKIEQQILAQGGTVISNWRLNQVSVDDKNPAAGGVLTFQENGASIHHCRFNTAHLSLGATSYTPNIYDLISVTGISMNALVLGAALTGGPITCDGVNHIVPLAPPQTIPMVDAQGKESRETVSFIRLTAAACVGPLDRKQHWYHYDGRHAVHLLHRARATLPANIKLKVLSVIGCNRVMGRDGRLVKIHPTINHTPMQNVHIYVGAGGGGLTQMAALL